VGAQAVGLHGTDDIFDLFIGCIAAHNDHHGIFLLVADDI
jgi:hypothetical protein